MKRWLMMQRWRVGKMMLFGALKVLPAGPARDLIAIEVRSCAGPLIAGFAAASRRGTTQ